MQIILCAQSVILRARHVLQQQKINVYAVKQELFYKLVLTKSVYRRVCLMSLKIVQMSIVPCAQNVILHARLVLQQQKLNV